MRRISILVVLALLCAAAPMWAQGTLPVGSAMTINLDQSVSSKDAKVNQVVTGSTAADMQSNGKTVIPRGSRVTLTVIAVQASGRLSTPAKLALRMTSVEVRGKKYTVSSSTWSQTGESHTKRNTVAIGGGTAAGAIIGGLAGGGKGAAIGAAAGAGAGTAGAAATGKKDITLNAETKLKFTLKSALTIQ